jgi:hypothetical protein
MEDATTPPQMRLVGRGGGGGGGTWRAEVADHDGPEGRVSRPGDKDGAR